MTPSNASLRAIAALMRIRRADPPTHGPAARLLQFGFAALRDLAVEPPHRQPGHLCRIPLAALQDMPDMLERPPGEISLN